MIRRLCICAILAYTYPASALADFLGVYVGVSRWATEIGGDFQTRGDSRIDAEELLDIDDESGVNLYANLEHPIPLLPNVRLSTTDITFEDTTSFANAITFVNESLVNDVAVSIDVNHLDGVLYYELLDNWVSLDLGVAARRFEGSIEITETATNASPDASIDETLGMLYAAAKFDLPFTGWHILGTGLGLGFDGHGHNDITLVLGYEKDLLAGFDIGFELGYRLMNLSLDDLRISDANRLNTNLNLQGIVLGATLNF